VEYIHPPKLRAGLYTCHQDGVHLFASDVLYTCDLFVAASQNKKSTHAQTLVVRPPIVHNRRGYAAVLPFLTRVHLYLQHAAFSHHAWSAEASPTTVLRQPGRCLVSPNEKRYAAANGWQGLNDDVLQGQRVPEVAKLVKAKVADLLPSALDGSLGVPGSQKGRSKASTPEPEASGSAAEKAENDADADLTM
jgi:hypothetical protein